MKRILDRRFNMLFWNEVAYNLSSASNFRWSGAVPPYLTIANPWSRSPLSMYVSDCDFYSAAYVLVGFGSCWIGTW
jgi:hypothetical protein